MSILHSQLAVYGAIDELVLQARKGENGAKDDELLKTAATLLPNSTGFGQAGWFRELTRFVNQPGIRTSGTRDVSFAFPSLKAATAELGRVPPPGAGTRAKVDSKAEAEAEAEAETETADRSLGTAGGFENRTLYDSENDPALARAGYGAFVLNQLEQILDIDRSKELEAVVDVAVRAFHPDYSDASVREAGAGILAGSGIITSRAAFTDFVTGNLKLEARFAADSLPCFGSLQQINGRYCSTVVTTSTDPALSVNDVARVVEPVNWHICSKFFCKIVYNDPPRNAGRWCRLSETIGAECDEYGLTTDLVFYKARHADGSISINYDIDPDRDTRDPTSADRGFVEVDNGYIWIRPDNDDKDPDSPGVRIFTSKQEHVNGLSPCATAALACLMGWGDAGREMLAGTAHRLIEAERNGRNIGNLKPFYPSTADDDPWET